MAKLAETGNVVVHADGMVECKESGLTEFPTVYPWKRSVGYDHPERYTEKERAFIRKTLVGMKRG